jgi:hypothetical protein
MPKLFLGCKGSDFALFSNNFIDIDSQNQRNVDKSLIYFAYGRKNNGNFADG